MILDRQRPWGIRQIHAGYEDQVPDIVASYVHILIQNATQNVDQDMLDYALRKIKNNLYVEQRPDRQSFESAFMTKRAFPAELKIDPQTDRIYLIGIGLPGREELRLVEEDVVDDAGVTQFREQITTSVICEDAVLVYTEVSWREYYTAMERLEKMEPIIQKALCRYFQIPEHLLIGTLLATPGLSDEDLNGIAMYALQQPS